jgi:hypothetical protein
MSHVRKQEQYGMKPRMPSNVRGDMIRMYALQTRQTPQLWVAHTNKLSLLADARADRSLEIAAASETLLAILRANKARSKELVPDASAATACVKVFTLMQDLAVGKLGKSIDTTLGQKVSWLASATDAIEFVSVLQMESAEREGARVAFEQMRNKLASWRAQQQQQQQLVDVTPPAPAMSPLLPQVDYASILSALDVASVVVAEAGEHAAINLGVTQDVMADISSLQEAATRLAKSLKTARHLHAREALPAMSTFPAAQRTKINIASGNSKVPGWLNIDGSRDLKPDLHFNVAHLKELLVPPGSVKLVYCSHFLEHLYLPKAKALLMQVYELLEPGGLLRVVVPDAKALFRGYVNDDTEFLEGRKKIWFWWDWEGMGPTLESIVNYIGVENSLPLAGTSAGGHRYGYDADSLRFHLAAAGFTNITQRRYKESASAEMSKCDAHSLQAGEQVIDGDGKETGTFYSLFIEASRPAAY